MAERWGSGGERPKFCMGPAGAFTPSVAMARVDTRTSTQILRFLAVGGSATIVHFAILIGLVEWIEARPTLATSIGYACSAGFNYWANRRFTFRSGAVHETAIPRFILMCLAGLALNAAGMWLWTAAGLHYVPSQILTTFAVVSFNYLIASHWVFPKSAAEKSGTEVE